jgi:hypothetical protein
MKRLAAALLGLLLLVAGVWWYAGTQHDLAHAGIAIGGGDGGGLPRATPGDEHVNAAAIDAVRAAAAQQRLDFLLVARHGHLLLDYYANPQQSAALRNSAMQRRWTLRHSLPRCRASCGNR